MCLSLRRKLTSAPIRIITQPFSLAENPSFIFICRSILRAYNKLFHMVIRCHFNYPAGSNQTDPPHCATEKRAREKRKLLHRHWRLKSEKALTRALHAALEGLIQSHFYYRDFRCSCTIMPAVFRYAVNIYIYPWWNVLNIKFTCNSLLLGEKRA